MPRLTGLLQMASPTETTQHHPVVGAPTSADATAGPPNPGEVSRRSRMERRVLLVGAALLGGVLAAVVLAGALSDAMTSRAAALDARQANQAILERVEAARREIAFAQTPAYLSFASRSFGWGTLREHAFALKPGGPPPPVIEPLGAKPTVTTPVDPLQSVLELLFER